MDYATTATTRSASRTAKVRKASWRHRRDHCLDYNLSHKCRLSRVDDKSHSHEQNNWTANPRYSAVNCDNYNTMCQLYKSINSREMFPIIKQSHHRPQSWNTLSQSSRRIPHLNYAQLLTRTVITILVLSHGAWSWTARRDPSFYQQSVEDYSDVAEEKQPFLFNSLPSEDESGLPKFGKTPRLIEGTVGQTVIMSCVVHNLASKRVTWMRMRDLQILTHGPLLFTSDVRVSSERPYGDHSRWGLMISDLRVEDSGKYECQVNSEPPMKLEVELVVREQQQSDMPFVPAGRTVIEGPREEVVKIGTVVVFSCSARHQFSLSDQLQPVVWLKDGNPIDKFETARGGVNVMTDWRPTIVTSKLTLITASSSDNGVYSCTVPGSGTDKVTLFIDEVEAQANTHSGSSSLRSLIVPVIVIIPILKFTRVLS